RFEITILMWRAFWKRRWTMFQYVRAQPAAGNCLSALFLSGPDRITPARRQGALKFLPYCECLKTACSPISEHLCDRLNQLNRYSINHRVYGTASGNWSALLSYLSMTGFKKPHKMERQFFSSKSATRH